MKSLVKKSFDRALDTYETSANIQRIVAEYLSGLVEKDYYENVLELGIGTGLFTQLFTKRVSYNTYTAVDISNKLIKKAKESFENINLINADAENLPLKIEVFDIITASSLLQWLENPSVSIPNLLNKTKKGCEVYFSIFIKGTFREMEYLYPLTNFGHVFNLKSEAFYRKTFGSLNEFEWEFKREDYVLTYDSVTSFLRQHKNTGATYSPNKRFASKRSYLTFCSLYHKLFSLPSGKIYATYSILYVKSVKKGYEKEY